MNVADKKRKGRDSTRDLIFGVSLNRILINNMHDYIVKHPSDNQPFDAKFLSRSHNILW